MNIQLNNPKIRVWSKKNCHERDKFWEEFCAKMDYAVTTNDFKQVELLYLFDGPSAGLYNSVIFTLDTDTLDTETLTVNVNVSTQINPVISQSHHDRNSDK